jgi:cholera toxin transcriptional activator
MLLNKWELDNRIQQAASQQFQESLTKTRLCASSRLNCKLRMPGNHAHRIFRFGVFEVNEAAGELRKHGVRIKLHSQPFKVLMLLLERPSGLVTREEMRERLWGTETFVDFDHGLNTAVNKIREALGDSASVPRYVETVSGRGYRFLAPVTLEAPAVDISDEQAAAPDVSAHAEGIGARITAAPTSPVTGSAGAIGSGAILTTPEDLPVASRMLVRTLLLLIQIMYLGFYLGALTNLNEINEIFLEAGLIHHVALMSLLVTTAAVLIPVRLFIMLAVALDYQNLREKFSRLFPVLFIFDLLWAVSPFLLIHHINTGLALGLSAPLVYMPFAQRSLVLMYSRRGEAK